MLRAHHEIQSIAQVQKAIAEGQTTVIDVVEQHLKAIEELDPKLNAIVAVNYQTIAKAKKLDVSAAAFTIQWRLSFPSQANS